MVVSVADGVRFSLESSLLLSEQENIDQLELSETQSVKGCVITNGDMQIMPMLSAWLSDAIRFNTISPNSAKTYARNLSYFLAFLERHPLYKNHHLDEAFLDIQEHTIAEYIAYMKEELGLSSKTIRNRDASVQAFFNNYLCATRGNKEPIRKDNPYSLGLLSPAPKSKLIEMCEIDELIALLRCTESERERALIQFMYDSGVRRSEIIKIKQYQIDDALNFGRKTFILDDNTIQVPSNYKPIFIDGVKGRRRESKPRHTLVSIESLTRVKRYQRSPLFRRYSKKLGNEAPAFLNAEGNRYTASAIGKLLGRLSKRALKRGYITRAIHPHMLRHGFAGAILRSPDHGHDAIDRLITIQVCLGHSYIATTQVYTSLPYDIYGTISSREGRILRRYEIMARVWAKTKLRIMPGDKK